MLIDIDCIGLDILNFFELTSKESTPDVLQTMAYEKSGQ